jgi:hypothetical protein
MSSYIPIASQTLGSSASSVTFSSIPTTLGGKTLRDLVLVANVIPNGSAVGYSLRFNGDSTSSYFSVIAEGNGSSASSNTYPATTFEDIYNVAGVGPGPSIRITQVFDYSQTSKHKSILSRVNNPGSAVAMAAGRYAKTDAITSVVLLTDAAAGTTFSLYGIEG